MAFGGYLQANTAVDLMVGPFVDDTDGKTAETGLTITQAEVRLSKNGGNMAQKTEATALSHDELGNYVCKLDATDTNTEGILTLMIHESGALPIKMDYMVLAQAAYISHVTAKDTGYMDTHVKTVEAGIIANASFNADVGSTAHGTNIIALAVRKILEELNLDHLLKVDTTVAADGDLENYVVAGTVLAHLMAAAADATAFKASTDSLEAIRVHADTIKAETASIQTETTALDTLTKAAGDGDLAAVLVDTAAIQGKLPTNKFMGSSDGADDDGTLNTIAADAARLTAVRAAVLTDLIDGGRLDLLIDAILADTGTDGVKLANDAITSAKYDESTAFPISSVMSKAGNTIVAGTVSWDNTNATTTVLYSDDITEATADHYNGRIIIFTTNAVDNRLVAQATDITDYELAAGEGKFTYTAITDIPQDNCTFVIV